MADPLGTDVFDLRVKTTGSTFVSVSDVTAYDHGTTRTTNKVKVFGRATPYSKTNKPDGTYSITALLNPTDAGQAQLLSHEAANTVATIEVFATGGTTDGFQQDVAVSSKRHTARADGDFQEITFDFAASADPVLVGAGIVI